MLDDNELDLSIPLPKSPSARQSPVHTLFDYTEKEKNTAGFLQ